MDFIGWIGCGLLASCSIPQCLRTYKTKSAKDISALYLCMWFAGMVCSSVYVITDDLSRGESFQYPLLLNYFINFFMAGYLIYAKYRYNGK